MEHGMNAQELTELAEAVWGPRFQRRLADAVGVDPQTIRRFLKGTGRLRPEVIQRIRNVVNIGEPGAIIRSILKSEVGDSPPYNIHRAATRCETELYRQGYMNGRTGRDGRDEDDENRELVSSDGGRRSPMRFLR